MKNLLFLIKALIFTISLIFTTIATAANLNQILKDARSNIVSENYTGAYKLLHQHLDEFAGNPEYDYLLGLAAARANELGEAAIALDRAIIVEPNNGEAVLMRAIVFYQMEKYGDAKTEFIKLKEANPPANIANVVDKYLSLIEEKTKKNRHFFNLGLDIGYNSNVNTAENQTIKMLGSEALKTQLKSLGSTFNTLRFNWNSSWFLTKSWRLNTGAYLANQITHFKTKIPQQDTILQDYSYLIALLTTDAEWAINPSNKLNFGITFTEILTSLRFEHLYMNIDFHSNYVWDINSSFRYTPGIALNYSFYNKFGNNPKTKKPFTESEKLSAKKNNYLALILKNNFRYLALDNLVLNANADIVYEHANKIDNQARPEGFEIRSGGSLLALQTVLGLTYYINAEHSVGANLNYRFGFNLMKDFNFQNEGKGKVNRIANRIGAGIFYDYVPFSFMKINLALDMTYNLSNVKYFNYLQFIPKLGLDFYF